MDSTLTFIVVFVFKPKRLAILNWSIFFCKKERAFLISGEFFLLLVEYVFLNLYFIFWHAFLKFKIKHSRVVIWELSICSLRWVPVLSIHSTILHTVRLATHPKYELYMCILQLELIFLVDFMRVPEGSFGSHQVSGCQWRHRFRSSYFEGSWGTNVFLLFF